LRRAPQPRITAPLAAKPRRWTPGESRVELELLGKRRPDLVLLDFMMPIMDGPAMLKAMEEDPVYAAFLRKPVKLAAVTNVVKTVLGQHS
jgi:CheY-like chemotaxis protein